VSGTLNRKDPPSMTDTSHNTPQDLAEQTRAAEIAPRKVYVKPTLGRLVLECTSNLPGSGGDLAEGGS
jgi:hypothetical protein